MDVWGGFNVRVEKEADTIPVIEKKVPHVKVLSEKLMMRCGKAWPREVTQQANWRVPIRDWRSHRWQTYLDDHPNSTDREGRKVFFRGNQDHILKQGKDLEQSCCTEGAGCW